MRGWHSVAGSWDVVDEDKLGELIIYTAGQLLDDPTGGAVKINKVLFFAECSHVRTYGVPITGTAYQKLPQGPAPRQLVPVRQRLIDSGAARLEVTQFLGMPQHRLIPLRPPRADSLSQEECTIVDEVIGALWGKTGTQVSELSHRELGWNMVAEYEDIPLSTAYLPPRAVMSDAAKQRARALAAGLPSTN